MSQLELFGYPEPPEDIEFCWNRADMEAGLIDKFCELDCIACHESYNRNFTCNRELKLYGRTHSGDEWARAKEAFDKSEKKGKDDGKSSA